MVQDREDHGYAELNRQAQDFIAKANQTPGLNMVYTLFDVGTPRVYADVDRRKADLLGVPPERVFEAMPVYLGSAFVNDFNLLGRYRKRVVEGHSVSVRVALGGPRTLKK